jgi:hypothetical protein
MRKNIVLIVCNLLSYSAMCQLAVDSSFHQPAYAKAIEEFLEAKGQNLPVYNGIQHVGYPPLIQGSAYYKSNDWQKGSVLYDGVLYKDVFLKYDMLKDELIIRQPSSLLGVILFSPRVYHFSLWNSTFTYKHKADSASIAEGFYEQLVMGKMSLLAKRKEIIEETIINTELFRKFVHNDQYYVMKADRYYAIKNQKDMLHLLGEKKKEIQKYLKKNKVKFKKDPENTLIKIAEQYNQAID